MRVLILGGYGNTGFYIAKLLLKETDVYVVIAGRNEIKAKTAANKLNLEFETERAKFEIVDASNKESCLKFFATVDFVIVASSTIEYVQNVAEAALECNIDYLDTQLSSKEKLEFLNSIKTQIKSQNRVFITDGGYHPGLPAAMIRYSALKFDKLIKANAFAYMQINWKELKFSDATREEFILELRDFNPLVFKNKKWQKLKMSDAPKFDFESDFGKRVCFPMMMEELKLLPEQIENLEETGFYIAGFDWFTNLITMPLGMVLLKVAPNLSKRFVGKLFEFGTNNFVKPPFGVQITVIAEGEKDGKKKNIRMTLYNDDGYYLTAVPVVAAIKQYLSGKLNKPGLHIQANFVEPVEYFEDIAKLNGSINIEEI